MILKKLSLQEYRLFNSALRTGGICHLCAPLVHAALITMDLDTVDLIMIANAGNLVCPSEYDTGAVCKVAILSVPEADDKELKYSLIFFCL
ncbi:MAG TPA: hypothetical protein VLH18_08765 [Candidatus Limnocylindrales bacterium]|nr:hypothetical protein [Candidatus Limnocylindrales bacterium]